MGRKKKQPIIDDNVLLRAEFLDGTILKNSFDLLEDYCLETLHMSFIKNGVEIKSLDASHTCGYFCSIGLDHMKEMSGTGQVFFLIDDYQKSLKKRLKGKTIIEVGETDITFKVGRTFHKLKLIEEEPLWDKIPSFDYSLVEIKTSDFVEGVDSIMDYGSDFEFSLTKDKFEMTCGDDRFSKGNFSLRNKELLTLQMQKDTKKAVSRFNPELVKDHMRIFKMSKSIEIGLGTDTPILIRPQIYGIRATIFIAPKVDKEGKNK